MQANESVMKGITPTKPCLENFLDERGKGLETTS